jgi:putative CocE/NonD family hydrolase
MFLALTTAGAMIASPPCAIAQDATYETVNEFAVMVSMRDNARLATDVFRPDAEGRFPTILSRTPYGRAELQSVATALAPAGYAFVLQDVRGRFDSEGEWEPFRHDAGDGFDTIEWITSQPWSDGKVVMLGGSYAAGVQWLAAREQPEGLVGLIPFVSPGNIYSVVWTGGVLSQSVAQTWSWLMEGKSFTPDTLQQLESLPWSDVFDHLPVADALSLVESRPDFYQRWLEHNTPDAYWEPMGWQHSKIDLPVLHTTGWYDIFQSDTIGNYEVMRQNAPESSRNLQRLVVGPWAHQGMASQVGEVDFGEDAALDFFGQEVLPFLNQCFNDAEPSWEKPVRVFTMGENKWNDYEDWPVPGAVATEFFLRSIDGANSRAGDGLLSRTPPLGNGSVDQFVSDPSDPVPSHGGDSCCWPNLLPWGPMDQGTIEDRADVLVYSTPPLQEDLRVTGPVEVVLYVSSSTPDADFTAKLVDVDPDGVALNLTDGVQRVRYRASMREAQLLEPGEIVEVRIDMGSTSNLFRAGHQVRIEIAGSNFPRYSRNTNTGEKPETDTATVIAEQSVYCSPDHPTRLVLPVLP